MSKESKKVTQHQPPDTADSDASSLALPQIPMDKIQQIIWSQSDFRGSWGVYAWINHQLAIEGFVPDWKTQTISTPNVHLTLSFSGDNLKIDSESTMSDIFIIDKKKVSLSNDAIEQWLSQKIDPLHQPHELIGARSADGELIITAKLEALQEVGKATMTIVSGLNERSRSCHDRSSLYESPLHKSLNRIVREDDTQRLVDGCVGESESGVLDETRTFTQVFGNDISRSLTLDLSQLTHSCLTFKNAQHELTVPTWQVYALIKDMQDTTQDTRTNNDTIGKVFMSWVCEPSLLQSALFQFYKEINHGNQAESTQTTSDSKGVTTEIQTSTQSILEKSFRYRCLQTLTPTTDSSYATSHGGGRDNTSIHDEIHHEKDKLLHELMMPVFLLAKSDDKTQLAMIMSILPREVKQDLRRMISTKDSVSPVLKTILTHCYSQFETESILNTLLDPALFKHNVAPDGRENDLIRQYLDHHPSHCKHAITILQHIRKPKNMLKHTLFKTKEYSELIKGMKALLQAGKKPRHLATLLHNVITVNFDSHFQQRYMKELHRSLPHLTHLFEQPKPESDAEPNNGMTL